VYVSDNPAKDFLGARRAGMRSIRVRRAGGIYTALEPETPEYAPDAEVGDLERVPRALDEL
jgi:FMN phosphatase YigB (HAD superfamily)